MPDTILKLVRSVLASMHDTYASIADYAAILRRRHVLADPALLHHVAHGALRAAAGGFVPTFDPAALEVLGGDSRLSTRYRVADLTVPTHMVRGALSSMVSNEGAQRLVASLPSATLAVVPMAGRSVHIDNPRALLAALAPVLVH